MTTPLGLLPNTQKHADLNSLRKCAKVGGGKEKQSGTKAKVQGRAKTSVPTKLT